MYVYSRSHFYQASSIWNYTLVLYSNLNLISKILNTYVVAHRNNICTHAYTKNHRHISTRNTNTQIQVQTLYIMKKKYILIF